MCWCSFFVYRFLQSCWLVAFAKYWVLVFSRIDVAICWSQWVFWKTLQTSNTTYFFIGFGIITLDSVSRFQHVVQLHSFVPFSSCPSSNTNSPFIFEHEDITTTKLMTLYFLTLFKSHIKKRIRKLSGKWKKNSKIHMWPNLCELNMF